jgi:hypothetical protein
MIMLHVCRDSSPGNAGCGRALLLVAQGGAEELPALGRGGLGGVGVAQSVDHDEVVDDALVSDGGDRDADLTELGGVGLRAAAAQGGRYSAVPMAGTVGARPLNRLRRACRYSVTGWPTAAPGRVRIGRPAARRRWHSSCHRCRQAKILARAAAIRHRHRQPRRGIASVVGTSDRADRIGAHELLR